MKSQHRGETKQQISNRVVEKVVGMEQDCFRELSRCSFLDIERKQHAVPVIGAGRETDVKRHNERGKQEARSRRGHLAPFSAIQTDWRRKSVTSRFRRSPENEERQCLQ